MEALQDIEHRLKALLIEALGFEDLTPDDIDAETPLFGEDGLGLDSVDALELVMILDKHFGILIEDPEMGKEVLASIRVMAEYVLNHRKK